MNTVKKFFALGIVMLAGVLAHAQKVSVSASQERINGKNCEGYSTLLTGSLEEVNTSLTKYLKTFGKVKSDGNQFQVLEAQVNLTKYVNPFFAVTKAKGGQVSVWMGATDESDSVKSIRSELEKLVYNFGVKFYKDKIQADIDESLRAQNAAEKQQQRLTLEGKNLASRQEMNAKEKIRLQKALADNKLDSIKFVVALARNKKSADSLAIATEQIKKMVETHKERQRKVN
ncbi:MAG TPA: hypothetical protein PK325_12440 [Cyclobacteriaceae bacterium]|nr:hypothetical protein [Cyclobacteriaceae bacterium]HMV07945.1 hypothetical protein [Cyclobacteriaceae bacterium]HMV88213.1 hypothetical protein [Cyclobacteriaceae bacterium]HMW99079.1 hypothetical protein [Cyclobacteriaceae bacterium]HMX48288.1 hypothetical protein [Cyclobacteriaceae bacterium]